MHLDQFGVLEYRIRKLEIIQEIIVDARACSSVYAKAGLTRGIFERRLEEDVAQASLPAFLLLIARHHRQDFRILQRTKQYLLNEENLVILQDRISATEKLRDGALRNAESLAASEPSDSEALRIYNSIKKSSSIESIAKAVYPAETFSRFYADYAALSPFVHGGNRETLVVTKTHGDHSPQMLSVLKNILDHASEQTQSALAFLRTIYTDQQKQKEST